MLHDIEVITKFDHLEILNDGATTEKMSLLELKPGDEFEIALSFRPTTIGDLRILGV
jgi:hypothetical protein